MGYTIWPDGRVGEILQAVYRERLRQEQLKADGKFLWTCGDNKVKIDPCREGDLYSRGSSSFTRVITNPEKLAVLAEEFGEVSREVTEQIIALDKARVTTSEMDANADALLSEPLYSRRKKLKEELVQLAAVAVAWAESLEA